MYCEKCQAFVENDSKYCVSCGSSINKIKEDKNAVCNSATNVNDRAESDSEDTQGVQRDSVQGGINIYTEENSNVPEKSRLVELSAKRKKPLSLGHSILIVTITLIPLLNIVVLLIWSFKKNTNVNKQNIARAILIVTLISFIIYVLLGGKVFTAGATI